MAIITIPRILQEKLTEEGDDALVQILDKVEEHSQSRTLETAEGRFEKQLETVKAELKVEIANVKAELKAEIANVKAELKVEIANVEKHLVKWMFIFWIGQFASIVGILTAILFAFFKR